MKSINTLFFCSLFSLLLSGQASAQTSGSSFTLPETNHLIGLAITVDNDLSSMDDNMQTRSFGFDDVEETFDLFETDSLERLFESMGSFTGYMDYDLVSGSGSGVDADINYQGIYVSLRYDENSPLIRFYVPDLDTTVICGDVCVEGSSSSIIGTSRDNSQDALVDYLEESDFSNRLNKLLAARSPTSPAAGNPSSLQSQLVANAFNKGTDTSDDDAGTATATERAHTSGNAFPVGLQFGRYRQDGKDTNNHSLPLGYAYRWKDGRRLRVDLPLSYVTIEDAEVYRIGLEVAYTHPINKQWQLTPGIGYGLMGSKDLLTGAQIGSVSLTSLYKLDESIIGGSDWSLSVANMVGYYKSFEIDIGDISVDPDLTNQIIKNGLIVDAQKTLVIPLRIKAYITDTRFFGDALYSERYNEIGIFLSPAKKKFGRDQGLNLSYLLGENDIKGFNLAYSYKF